MKTWRVGRLHVIPYAEWEAWKAKRVFPPDGYVQLSSIREPLAIKSDKLSEYARMGLIPTAIRCNPYGTKGPSTQFGTWWISKETADQLLADRRAGRQMPWHGKYTDNLRNGVENPLDITFPEVTGAVLVVSGLAAGEGLHVRHHLPDVATAERVGHDVDLVGGIPHFERTMADGAEKPRLRLDVVATAPLPGTFTAARTNANGVRGEASMLQLTKAGWAVYVAVPLTKAEKKAGSDRPAYHKADVSVGGDAIKVIGDRPWVGGDVAGAGSCEAGKAGAYAVSGAVPAAAAGLVDGTASVDAIQGVAGQADKAVAVMGDSVVLVKLVEAPAEGGDAPSSSSSAVPSK